MRHAEKLAAGHNTPLVGLYTNAAMTGNIAFYGRLGYSITKRKTGDGFEPICFKRLIATL